LRREKALIRLLDEAILLGQVQYLKADEAEAIRLGLITKLDRLLEELFRARGERPSQQLAAVYECISRIAAIQDRILVHGQDTEVQRELEEARELIAKMDTGQSRSQGDQGGT